MPDLGAFAVVGHLREAARAGRGACSEISVGRAVVRLCTHGRNVPRAQPDARSSLSTLGALEALRGLWSGSKNRSARNSSALLMVAVARAWLQPFVLLALRCAQRPGRRSVRAPASPVPLASARIGTRLSTSFCALRVQALPSATLCPNQSFERTSNSEARLRAPAWPQELLAAAQLQR